MDCEPRVVTALPLDDLWSDEEPVQARRLRALSDEQIQELLRHGSHQFVVAERGKPLRWLGRSEGLDFWNTEVQPRLVPSPPVAPNTCPDEYCCCASQWTVDDGKSVILIETYR